MTNKKIPLTTTYFISTIILLSSCTNPPTTTVSGTIDYIGTSTFFLEEIPLHYKYSQKNQIPIEVINGEFEITPEIDSPQIVYLVLQDTDYPIFIVPGQSTTLQIRRATFPTGVVVEGAGKQANEAYQHYLQSIDGLQSAINIEMDKYKMGAPNIALELAAKKVGLAKQYLAGTNFNDLYLKTVGEEFVLKIRGIEYSARHDATFDAQSARDDLILEALEQDFFSFETLQAQRAGIRDFTHYWSRTFGIYDSVIAAYGMDLAEYDIKRVAYKELNAKRIQILEYITEPKARAYAHLFLVAERIGEIPMDLAEVSYHEFLQNYPEYPDFIEFITWFHDEIKSVSPGEPAIPFNLPDRDGNMFSMADFGGKFVLLDFWAGWCQPCLEEFPFMRDIYQKYSREELEILGISTEVDRSIWLQDINRFKNPWPQLYGGKGFDQETFKGYKGGGIPFYILVDPDGKIARYNDMRPSFNFTIVLDSLLADYQTRNSGL